MNQLADLQHQDKTEIEDLLFSQSFPIPLQRGEIEVEHRSEGKTARVYKVNVDAHSFAVKVFEPNQWHAREIDILLENVQGVIPDTVRVIFVSDDRRFLVLDWIDGVTNANYDSIDYKSFAEWIINKTLNSRARLEGKKVDMDRQLSWMIDIPFNYIQSTNYASEFPVVNQVLSQYQHIRELFLKLTEYSLPTTIEHGDLEPQNVLIDPKGKVKIIDWAASFKSFGLLDVAQLRKDMYFAGKIQNYLEISKMLSPHWNLPNFEQSVILFSIIRQVQVLQYCHENKFPADNIQIQEALEMLDNDINLLV